MAISGAVIKIKDDMEEKITQELEKISGINLEGKSPSGELILLIEAENLGSLHKKCTQAEKINGVLGIYPAYVTTEDEQ